MFLRLMMLSSVLVSTLGYQFSGILSSSLVINSYYVVFFTFLVTSCFVFLYEKTRSARYFLVSQVCYDIFFTTALIFYTESYDSVYTIFYFFNIIFCAILFRGRLAAISAALASSGLYAFIFWLNSANIRDDKFFPLLTTVTAFISIALLSGQLVEELRRSRQHVSKLESLSGEIVDSLDSGLLGLNADEVVERVNRTALSMLGIRSEQSVIGRTLSDLLPAFIDAQGSQIREIAIKGKNRRMLVTRVTLTESHSMILLRDLTEVLDLEEKVRRQERLAGVGRLATGVAHEIRNPIASISGAAQLLGVDGSDSDEKRRLTDIIVRESERVDRLVTQLLKFAKPPVGQRVQLDLRDVIRESVESMRIRPDFQNSGIDLQVKINGPLLVKGNKDELNEVIGNLFVNAMQALLDHKPAGAKIITLEGKRVDSQIVVSVSDNGPGIPREFRSRIFDPFFTTKASGTGLGLAQVHKIVRDHDGYLDVDTEEGRGTALTFRLPA